MSDDTLIKVLSVTPCEHSGTVQITPQVTGPKVATVIAECGNQTYEVVCEATDAGYVCTGFTAETSTDHPITGATLRAIPVQSLLQMAIRLAEFQSGDDGEAMATDSWRLWPDHVMQQWPHGDLDLVARWTSMTYALAVAHGIGPTKAVREAAGVGQSTSGRMIREARDRGILTTEPPTQTGGVRAKTNRIKHE